MALNGERNAYNSQSPSHVRTACEACHQRKIRCIMSTEGGPCQNCRSRDLSCFFLPRYRSGRPRSIRLPSPPETDITSPGGSGAFTPIPPATDNNMWDGTTRTSQHPNTTFAGSSFSTPLTETVFSPSHLQLAETEYNWHAPEAEQANADILSGGFTNIHTSEISEETFLTLDMPGQTWQGSWQQPQSGQNTPSQSGGQDQETIFANLLEHCGKLHRHLLRTRDNVHFPDSGQATPPNAPTPALSQHQLQAILKDIDASCHAMFSIHGDAEAGMNSSNQNRSDPDAAARALITAIVFKVFQVCDSLLDSDLLKGSCMSSVLMQKRLDFNITQASIVMSWVEQMTQREGLVSSDIEKRATSIAQRLKLAL